MSLYLHRTDRNYQRLRPTLLAAVEWIPTVRTGLRIVPAVLALELGLERRRASQLRQALPGWLLELQAELVPLVEPVFGQLK